MIEIDIQAAEEVSPPQVTYCAPGKRSKEIVYREKTGTVPVSTATALKMPPEPVLRPAPISDTLRTMQDRMEAAERADAQAVGIAQPHRQGSDDFLRGSPLGRFCLKSWKDRSKQTQHFNAGNDFAVEIRTALTAAGLHPLDMDEGQPGRPGGVDISPAAVAAARATRDKAERRVERINALLIEVNPRCARAMEKLCTGLADPSPYDEAMLVHGLTRLAKHYGVTERDDHRKPAAASVSEARDAGDWRGRHRNLNA